MTAAPRPSDLSRPNALEAYWLPFTPNRAFKKDPRIITRAEGMYYFDQNGRKVMDGASGLWCSNAGHCRPSITAAIRAQAGELDYSPSFLYGHPKVFELANRLTAMAPKGLDHAFFANSGSEACESALKIAIAYQRAIGQGTRTRLIGRERGYHGVNFGGISVGGMVNNRKQFGTLLTGVDHLPTTYNRAEQAFARGEPTWGAHLADELEKLVALHDASTIAAVIVEPMSGSGGMVPTPKGYLQKLRAICDKHSILLIFDEVITGFGRLAAPFGAERYGVVPDMITFAKGVTNGAVPMGGVLVKKEIYDAFMTGPEQTIELFHGYTYSGHPLACAAALATLDLYREEGLFENAKALERTLEEQVHSLKGEPNVVDIRNVGVASAIDLAPLDGQPGKRGYEVLQRCFHEAGVMPRLSGDTIVIAPCLIATADDVSVLIEGVRSVLRAVT
ncbi:MAG: aminotransferase class III-fold pyridoxal phosphate-dependent enzyme [Alphaproteobacteria bacterium]|nr:aminotransferase class III-fold pyridoxal phosphate-dependent enzyme [Alphaproteobacteria bacterium]